MIDIRLLRENLEEVRQGYARLGTPIDLDKVIAADARARDLKNESQTLQAAQNKISK
ncbi:MAG: serine--tRNA ligase, partial [Pseudomonadota bacterium]